MLWDYWRVLQQQHDGCVPPYAAFRPSRLASILPTMALSEYVDRDTQKIRLIGGGHDGFWPREAIGANLFDFVDATAAEGRKRLYQEVITRPCGCYFDEEGLASNGRIVRYRGLFLPFLDTNGKPYIFIGSYTVSADGFDLKGTTVPGLASRTTNDIKFVTLSD